MPANLVLIMTDNQGAWTLGCYGNQDIQTPNLDRLAGEGLRFSRAYCVNSVCSPSRATYLTGLLPSQHGVHCWLGTEKPDAQMGPEAYCTISEFASLPRLLSDAGYRCGLSGKWHLGDSLRPQEGFSYWFTRPKGHTHTFFGDDGIWDGEVYCEPRYFTDVITDHAVDFLEQQTAEQPFFLLAAYNGPYGLGEHMTYPHRNRHAAHYADCDLACFPREAPHPWLRMNRDFIGNPVSMKGYASAVSGVDDGVGQIVAALERRGLADDTLVVFCADQGLCAGHHGMWGMGDHSRPIHTFEEAVRIPLIFRHPRCIPGGRSFDGLTCNYDFFPSVLEHLGLSDRVPAFEAADASTLDGPRSPGRSYAPTLCGRNQPWAGPIFHEFENVRMVRDGRWKFTWRHPVGPDELYDLETDPGERLNLAGDERHADTIGRLRTLIQGFFDEYADLEYDLWNGGRSKAGRLLD